MTKSKTIRTRKTRRQQKAVMRHGKSAKPRHTGRSGRTGSMLSHNLKEKSR